MGSIKSRFKIVLTGVLSLAIITTSSIPSMALRADLGDGYQSELQGFNTDETGIYLENDVITSDGVILGDVIHIPLYIAHMSMMNKANKEFNHYNQEAYESVYLSSDAWGSSPLYKYMEIQIETLQDYVDGLYSIGWQELNDEIDSMPSNIKEKLGESYTYAEIKNIDTYLSEKLVEKGIIDAVASEYNTSDITSNGITSNIITFTSIILPEHNNESINNFNNLFEDKILKRWFQPENKKLSNVSNNTSQYHRGYLFGQYVVYFEETVPIFEPLSSDPTLITSARGDEIQVGAYLAPGALIYNTYNEVTDTTQKYILYEAPQTKKTKGLPKIELETFDVSKTKDYTVSQDGEVTQIQTNLGDVLDSMQGYIYSYYDYTKYSDNKGSNIYLVHDEINDSYYLYNEESGEKDENIDFDVEEVVSICGLEKRTKEVAYGGYSSGYIIKRIEYLYHLDKTGIVEYELIVDFKGTPEYPSPIELSINEWSYYGNENIPDGTKLTAVSPNYLFQDVSIMDSNGTVFYKVSECCDNTLPGRYTFRTNDMSQESQTVLEFSAIPFTADLEDENPISSFSMANAIVYYAENGAEVTNVKYNQKLTYVFCTPFGSHYPHTGIHSGDIFQYYTGMAEMNPRNLALDESYAVAKLSENYFKGPVQVSNIYSYDEFTTKYGLSDGNQLPEGEVIGKNFTITTSDTAFSSNIPKLSGYPDGYFDNVTFIELTSADGTRSSGAGVVMGTHEGNESDEAKQNAVQTDVSIPHTFTVMIPKKIVLDGQTKSADYTVSVTGDISGDETVVVKPEPTVTFSQEGKDDVIATITQGKTGFTSSDLVAATPAPGSVTAEDLSAGKWNGSFQFAIELN